MTGMLGEIACLAAALIWAGSVCLYRRYAADAPSDVLNLFKNVVAFTLLLVTLAFLRPELPTESGVWFSLGLSGLFGIAIGDTAGLAALKRLGAPVSAAGLCLGPVVTAMLSYFFLGETLNKWEWIGLSLTMLAVVGVIFSGRKQSLQNRTHTEKEIAFGIVCLLLSGSSHAIGVVLGRYGMQRTDVMLGTVLRIFPTIIVLSISMLVMKKSVIAPLRGSRTRFMYLLVAAVGGAYLGLVLMSLGLKHSKAGVATAILGTYPIWVVPIAHFYLGEKTTWRTTFYIVLASLGICFLVLAKS